MQKEKIKIVVLSILNAISASAHNLLVGYQKLKD